jgi:DUF3102 family protein
VYAARRLGGGRPHHFREDIIMATTDTLMTALQENATAFDYTTLASETANLAKQAADRIRARQRQESAAVIAIGKDLKAIKDRLDRGQFGRWLRAEFDWTERTARRYMQAAKVFDGQTDAVSVLSPTTLYLLSAKSTPETRVAKVIADLEAGDPIDQARIVADVHAARKRAKEARLEAQLSPRQRARKADQQAACKRAEQRLSAQSTAEKRVADFLANNLGNDSVAQLIELLQDTIYRALAVDIADRIKTHADSQSWH